MSRTLYALGLLVCSAAVAYPGIVIAYLWLVP